MDLHPVSDDRAHVILSLLRCNEDAIRSGKRYRSRTQCFGHTGQLAFTVIVGARVPVHLGPVDRVDALVPRENFWHLAPAGPPLDAIANRAGGCSPDCRAQSGGRPASCPCFPSRPDVTAIRIEWPALLDGRRSPAPGLRPGKTRVLVGPREARRSVPHGPSTWISSTSRWETQGGSHLVGKLARIRTREVDRGAPHARSMRC
jgi:hypothetical protein